MTFVIVLLTSHISINRTWNERNEIILKSIARYWLLWMYRHGMVVDSWHLLERWKTLSYGRCVWRFWLSYLCTSTPSHTTSPMSFSCLLFRPLIFLQRHCCIPYYIISSKAETSWYWGGVLKIQNGLKIFCLSVS